jgi:hypothetical protein
MEVLEVLSNRMTLAEADHRLPPNKHQDGRFIAVSEPGPNGVWVATHAP